MTEAQARTTANVVLAAAAIGAAYYILKTPPLRRRVWQMARSWAAGPLAAWAATEIRRAWDDSASVRPGLSASYGETGASARTGLSPAPPPTVGMRQPGTPGPASGSIEASAGSGAASG